MTKLSKIISQFKDQLLKEKNKNDNQEKKKINNFKKMFHLRLYSVSRSFCPYFSLSFFLTFLILKEILSSIRLN